MIITKIYSCSRRLFCFKCFTGFTRENVHFLYRFLAVHCLAMFSQQSLNSQLCTSSSYKPWLQGATMQNPCGGGHYIFCIYIKTGVQLGLFNYEDKSLFKILSLFNKLFTGSFLVQKLIKFEQDHTRNLAMQFRNQH